MLRFKYKRAMNKEYVDIVGWDTGIGFKFRTRIKLTEDREHTLDQLEQLKREKHDKKDWFKKRVKEALQEIERQYLAHRDLILESRVNLQRLGMIIRQTNIKGVR